MIGLVGLARVGKDMTADHICMKVGYEKRAFADPIYDTVDAMFGIDSRAIARTHDKEEVNPNWGLSLRQMLQIVGTEMGRDMIAKDIWLRRMDMELIKNPDLVITDVRHDNEAHFIKDKGGFLLHIERPDAIKVNPHSSEDGITDIEIIRDFHIINDGSVAELLDKVDTVIASGLI